MCPAPTADEPSTLADQPLPERLARLHRAATTGRLHIASPAGPVTIFFREGFPCAVELPGEIDRLGDVLVAAGALPASALGELLDGAPASAPPAPSVSSGPSAAAAIGATARAAAMAPGASSRLLGRRLVERGLVTAEQLVSSLRLQVRRRLHRLFFLDAGLCTLEPGAHTRGLEAGLELRADPYRAIYHGVKSAWTAPRLAAATASLSGGALRLIADDAALARYGLPEADLRAARLLADRPRSLAELCAAANRAPSTLHPLLYALSITDGVAPAEAAAAERVVRDVPLAIALDPPSPSRTIALDPPSPSRTIALDPPSPSKAIALDPPSPSRTIALDPPSPSKTIAAETSAGADDEVARGVRDKAALVDEQDLFAVLGLSQDAGPAEIKAAYFEAARRYHPDRFSSGELLALRADATRIFRRLNEAWSTLFDDGRRGEYLAELNRPPQSDEERAAEDAAQVTMAAELAFLEGEVAFRARDYPVAISALGRSVELNPNEGEGRCLLAWARFSVGQAPLADLKPELERAVRDSPLCARAHYYLGMAQKQESPAEQAIALAMASFRRAVELDARLIEAQSELRVLSQRAAKGRTERDVKPSLLDRFRGK